MQTVLRDDAPNFSKNFDSDKIKKGLALQDLVWVISLYQPVEQGGTGQLQYFLRQGERRSFTIGSSQFQDIFLHRAFPSHATIEVSDDRLIVRAQKKAICKWANQRQILTRGDAISISLRDLQEATDDLAISLKIKDSAVKCTLQRDDETLERWPSIRDFLHEKYHSLHKIGEGSTSLLYRLSKNSNQVLKITKPERVKEKQVVEKFLHSIEMSRLGHPQLLPAQDVIIEKNIGLYAYTSDFFAGESLYNLVVRHKQTTDHLYPQIIGKIVDFLRFLHSQNKVHRNLTPDNILVNSQGACKVVGLGTVFSPEDKIATEFSDIEIPTVDEKGIVPHYADIFSLGAILYFLLVGKDPFADIAPHEYLLSQLPLLKFPEPTLPYKELILASIGNDSSKKIGSVNEFWQIFCAISRRERREELIEDTSREMLQIASSKTVKVEDQEILLNAEPATEEQRKKETRKESVPAKERFGKYLIREKKGEGLLSTVYHAIDTRENRPVTLKIFDKMHLTTKADISRVLQDSQGAASLDHPNILCVYEVGEVKGSYYITTEYIEGCSLGQYVEDNFLSPERILSIVRDLARAIQYAHAKGVLHRNIKPSNIIIGAKYTPYLTDFGLAPEATANFSDNLKYIAPELLREEVFSPVQDVYSLGAVLKKIASRQSTLSKNDIRMPRVKNLTTVIPRPAKVSREIKAIYFRAMEYNPRHRYPNAIAFGDDIDRLLEYRPVLARYPGLTMRICKRILRYKFALSVFIVAFLALAAFTVSATTSTQSDIEELRTKAEQAYRDQQQQYLDALEKVSLYSTINGGTPEELEIREHISRDLIYKIRHRHKFALLSGVVPLLRQCANRSRDPVDKKRLREVTEEILSLCDTAQDRLDAEYWLGERKSPGKSYSRLHLNISPRDTTVHLFRFREEQDGSKTPLPFALETKKMENFSPSRQKLLQQNKKFVLAQNLLFTAIEKMAHRDFVGAKRDLEEAIAMRNDYIDAYFLLCCTVAISSAKRAYDEECIEWQRKGRACINSSSLDAKARSFLLYKFTPKFVGKMSELYNLLLSEGSFGNLLNITSLPPGTASLKIGDTLFQIDSRRVVSLRQLAESTQIEKKATCLILRNHRPRPLVVDTNLFRHPLFHATEEIPVFFIWNNHPLEFQNASIYLFQQGKKNRVDHRKPLNLPTGDYLLTLEHKGYLPMRYPLRITSTENETQEKIERQIEMIPDHGLSEDFFADFVAIAGDFSPDDAQPQYQNFRGYLIAKYELTMRDWGQYLLAQNRSDWPRQVHDRSPASDEIHPLFRASKSKLLLRRGKTTWPVFGVSYPQIKDYLAWYNGQIPEKLRKLGVKVRIPTLEEWQVAARGADERLYPWGDYANPSFCKIRTARAFPVGCERIGKYNPTFVHDESPFGVRDMAGSVAEYVLNPSKGRIPYAIKGGYWTLSTPVYSKVSWYSPNSIPLTVRGVRLCIGADPLFKEE